MLDVLNATFALGVLFWNGTYIEIEALILKSIVKMIFTNIIVLFLNTCAFTDLYFTIIERFFL